MRALVSKGWGGLGGDKLQVPENVYMLGNVPHDWLFKHVSAVCHHGGAGTTAAGIAAGRPTIVVPFFGDVSRYAVKTSTSFLKLHTATILGLNGPSSGRRP